MWKNCNTMYFKIGNATHTHTHTHTCTHTCTYTCMHKAKQKLTAIMIQLLLASEPTLGYLAQLSHLNEVDPPGAGLTHRRLAIQASQIEVAETTLHSYTRGGQFSIFSLSLHCTMHEFTVNYTLSPPTLRFMPSDATDSIWRGSFTAGQLHLVSRVSLGLVSMWSQNHRAKDHRVAS